MVDLLYHVNLKSPLPNASVYQEIARADIAAEYSKSVLHLDDCRALRSPHRRSSHSAIAARPPLVYYSSQSFNF